MTDIDHAAALEDPPIRETRPAPAPDDISRFFWDGAAEGRLLVQRCLACGRYQYPPDIICTYCQSETLEAAQVSGRGTLYSFVVVDRAFHPGFVPHLPYVLALVDLEEQDALRLLTNIVDAEPAQLSISMPVEVTFERRGEVTMPQFRPAGGTR